MFGLGIIVGFIIGACIGGCVALLGVALSQNKDKWEDDYNVSNNINGKDSDL